MIEQIAYPVIVWAVCGVAGFAVGNARSAARKHRKRDDDDRAMMESICDGIRSLLRNELVKEHRDMMQEGGCTLLDKEIANRNYVPYHALGGNGIGTKMYEEIMASKTLND